MKRSMVVLCIIATLLVADRAQARKVRLIEGSLEMLKDVKRLNIRFDYVQMRVGRYGEEEAYIKSKRATLDARARGRGGDWERAWLSDRREFFEPEFKDAFMKYSRLTVDDLPREPYTLIFKTTFTEPGYNVYVSRKNARINGEAWIVETANPERVLAKLSVTHAVGQKQRGDYGSGDRLREAYAAAGRGLGLAFSANARR